MIHRRAFMKSGSMALFAAGFGGVPNFIARAAESGKIIPPYKRNKVFHSQYVFILKCAHISECIISGNFEDFQCFIKKKFVTFL